MFTAEKIRRLLWGTLVFWTCLLGVLMVFDLGEAQVNALQLSSFFSRILQAADVIWIGLAAAFVYFYLIRHEGIAAARRATIAILLGSFFVSLLSLRTGFPLGPLIYTARLGTRLAGVPFGVPLLWLVVVVCARYVVLHLLTHAKRWQIALGGGFLAATTDIALEWIAWKIRVWWLWYFPLANTPDWPPLRNVATWFLLSALFIGVAFPSARPVGKHWKPVLFLAAMNLLFWLTIALRLR